MENKKTAWSIIGYIFFGIGILGYLANMGLSSEVEYITQQTYYVLSSISAILISILGANLIGK